MRGSLVYLVILALVLEGQVGFHERSRCPVSAVSSPSGPSALIDTTTEEEPDTRDVSSSTEPNETCEDTHPDGQKWSTVCLKKSRICVENPGIGPNCGECLTGFKNDSTANGDTCIAETCEDHHPEGQKWAKVCWDKRRNCVENLGTGPSCGECLDGFKKDDFSESDTCVVKTCKDPHPNGKIWIDVCSAKRRICFESPIIGPRCANCMDGFKEDSSGNKETCIAKICEDDHPDGQKWFTVCSNKKRSCVENLGTGPGCFECLTGFKNGSSRNSDTCIAETCEDTHPNGKKWIDVCSVKRRVCDENKISGPSCGECLDGFESDFLGKEDTCSESSTTSPPPPPPTTTTTTTGTTTSSTSTTTAQSTTTAVPKPLCCPAKTARGIRWDRHCGRSEFVSRPCPEGSVGKASWFCDTSKGEWSPGTPTLEDCKSDFMDDLVSKVNKSNVIEALDVLGENPPLFGGDLLGIGNILSDVVTNVEKFLGSVDNSTVKKELAVDITNKVATLGDNLLSDKNSWKDLTKGSRVQAATELLRDEESAAFQCAYNLDEQDVMFFEKKTFSMQIVKNQRGTHKNGLTLPQSLGYSSSPTTKFVLPPDFEEAIPDKTVNHTIVVFFEYKDLGDILVTKQDHSSGNVSSSSAVNSPVLSVSLNGDKVKVKFETRAHFFVPHTSTDAERAVCAFWNITSLNWEDEGCGVVKTTDTQTECACDHLTNFAVLMDVHDVLNTLSEEDMSSLETITLVGCVISIVFLSICIIVTTVYRKIWCLRNSVHRNLCVSLLIGEVVLVSGGDGTEIKVLCSIIAGLLHYFFTAAFCWMFLEAVVIYSLLYDVFPPGTSYTKRFYALGYGVPLLIVAISAASRPSGYGSDTACWLNTGNGIRWSFVGPVAFILAVNVLALVYALVITLKSERNRSKPGSPVTKTWILHALAFPPLLGSTWILGFVMVRNEPAFVYTFTVLNSLQGASIFIVLCMLHKNSRKCLMKSLRKYTILISTGSAASSSNRSISHTEAQRRSAPPTDSPSSIGWPQGKTKRTFPAFLRSISSQSAKFEMSADERSHGSDIPYSTSVSYHTGVVFKRSHAVGEESS